MCFSLSQQYFKHMPYYTHMFYKLNLLISLDLTQINLEELLVLRTFETSFAYMSEHRSAQNFNEFINFSVKISLDII